MTRSEVETAVRHALETVLRRPLSPGEDVRRADESAWDSLKHVELVFAIEETLDIQFDAEELGELDSCEKLVDSAQSHLRARG